MTSGPLQVGDITIGVLTHSDLRQMLDGWGRNLHPSERADYLRISRAMHQVLALPNPTLSKEPLTTV